MLLTWNEEANITACLAALARQRQRDFEVLVVDAASTDRTVPLVEEAKRWFPVPLHLEAATRKLPIGEARNVGVGLAKAPLVAFLSADAEVDDHWVEATLSSLAHHDMVFGRQVHEPHRWTVGAAVRGLRYHFPDGETDDPLRYASNVSAGYRAEILRTHPFDPWTNAAEDLLLARRATRAGYRATYNPRAVVYHHDVTAARDEMRKNVREGHGWGLYRDDLGLFVPLLAWGGALVAALCLFAVFPGLWTLLLFAALLWLPSIRRAARRYRSMPPGPLILGVAASPVFDVAFLVHYVRGLLESRKRRAPAAGLAATPEPKESQP